MNFLQFTEGACVVLWYISHWLNIHRTKRPSAFLNREDIQSEIQPIPEFIYQGSIGTLACSKIGSSKFYYCEKRESLHM
jgi:hypothetical protein